VPELCASHKRTRRLTYVIGHMPNDNMLMSESWDWHQMENTRLSTVTKEVMYLVLLLVESE
jgi:hypothetical protein